MIFVYPYPPAPPAVIVRAPHTGLTFIYPGDGTPATIVQDGGDDGDDSGDDGGSDE